MFCIVYDICFCQQQMEHLKAFIKDCDRKIVLAKKRLAETQDDFDNTTEVLINTLLCECGFHLSDIFKLLIHFDASFALICWVVLYFVGSSSSWTGWENWKKVSRSWGTWWGSYLEIESDSFHRCVLFIKSSDCKCCRPRFLIQSQIFFCGC